METKEDWEKVIKESEERLEQIKQAKVQQSIAEKIQTEILKYAKEILTNFE